MTKENAFSKVTVTASAKNGKLTDVQISSEGEEGKDLLIGFNPRFLSDALRAVSDEKVNLYLSNSRAPGYIRDDEGTYIYLILPVNFVAR